MFYIPKITSDPQQNLRVTGIAGVTIDMTLRYLPRMRLWDMGLTYGDISINGIIITASTNIIRQFKNRLPFGIACVTADGLDPYDLDVFEKQNAVLFVLTQEEVAQIESEYFNG